MRRVLAFSDGMKHITTPQGREVKRSKDGTFSLSDRNAKALAKEGSVVIVPDMGPGRRQDGYRCVECGWGSWFKTCSRCGGECFRETDS